MVWGTGYLSFFAAAMAAFSAELKTTLSVFFPGFRCRFASNLQRTNMLSALPTLFPLRNTSAIVSRLSKVRWTLSSSSIAASTLKLRSYAQSSRPTHCTSSSLVPQ